MSAPTSVVQPIRSAVAGAVSRGVDLLRPVHPVDAILERVRQAWLDREAKRDPYPSQEWVSSLNIGRSVGAEKWHERQSADARLKAQTDSLADALERTGVQARGSNDVTAIGLITGEVEPINGYRSICFLPQVAQRDRRPMLNELRYFRREHRAHGKFMRYGVVTNGPTVTIGGMPPARDPGEPKSGAYFEGRERIRDLSRALSRFAEWARTRDIDVVYRGIEFTVKRRNGDELLSIHPHANVLYTPTRRLTKDEWDAFLRDAGDQLGGWWWKDCGVLKDPNEAIKYAFKPMELEGLSDAGVRWLYEQTFGLKMAQPMGAFKDWRSRMLWLEERRSDGVLRRRQFRKVVMAEYASGPRLELCSVKRRPGKPDKAETVVQDSDRPPAQNVFMGITMPQRRFSRYSEPCLLVMNYAPGLMGAQRDQAAIDEWDLLRSVELQDRIEAERGRALPVWYMNGAPDPAIAVAESRGQAAARAGEAAKVTAFRVHTRSSTAEQKTRDGPAHGPPTAELPPAVHDWRLLGVDFSTG